MTDESDHLIATVLGTRPEAIKLAPVIREVEDTQGCRSVVISTAQHRDILDPVLELFGIDPDHDLGLMREGQSLEGFASRALDRVTERLEALGPDLVLVQGDTTTAMVGALAAFYARTPTAHVEAGLRSHDRWTPYPEEMNRRLISSIAELHFAPTDRNRRDLLSEGVPDETIHVTGNPVTDALIQIVDRSGDDPLETVLPGIDTDGRRIVLVTLHRRESFGRPLEEICEAIRAVAEEHQDVLVTYPVHPNPEVRRTVEPRLGGHERIRLLEPLGYREFVALMNVAHVIVTDSGGVQEEAPSLGVPVLVLREVTERPEAVEAGSARLVERRRDRVKAELDRLLENRDLHSRMSQQINPYGDGKAASRIVEAAQSFLLVRSAGEEAL